MNLSPGQSVVDISNAIGGYCTDHLFPLLLSGQAHVTVRGSRSRCFNATVMTSDHENYTIIVNDGIIVQLQQAIDALHSETIDDVIADLSGQLFGHKANQPLVYDSLLYGSVLFILLHEITHIRSGHFSYLRDQAPSDRNNYSYSEIEHSSDLSEEQLDSHDLKLIELEADAGAIDLLTALSHELFCANEDVRLALVKEDSVDCVSQATRSAAEDLMFYSASLALSLIEATREGSDDYPYPYTRIFHMTSIFIRQTFFQLNNELTETESGLLSTDNQQIRKAIAERIIPVFFSAMEIADSAAQNLEFDLRGKFSSSSVDEPIESTLTRELIVLTTQTKPDTLVTPEGAQLAELRLLSNEFSTMLSAYRLRSTEG